jgi:hypothetical protein
VALIHDTYVAPAAAIDTDDGPSHDDDVKSVIADP